MVKFPLAPLPLTGEGLTHLAGFDFDLAFDVKSPATAPVMI